MRVDPNNRLVADNLERLWNEKLQALAKAQEEYERDQLNGQQRLNEEQRQRIRQLASDFPKLWRDPKTTYRDRKRMIRLLIEDVTLKRGEATVGVHIRFRGGMIKELQVALPLSAPEARRTGGDILRQIDELLENHDENQVAEKLNASGLRSSCNHSFNRARICRLCLQHKLRSRAERLRERGYVQGTELAKLIGIHTVVIPHWRNLGLIKGFVENFHVGYFYEIPSEEIREKIRMRSRKLSLET